MSLHQSQAMKTHINNNIIPTTIIDIYFPEKFLSTSTILAKGNPFPVWTHDVSFFFLSFFNDILFQNVFHLFLAIDFYTHQLKKFQFGFLISQCSIHIQILLPKSQILQSPAKAQSWPYNCGVFYILSHCSNIDKCCSSLFFIRFGPFWQRSVYFLNNNKFCTIPVTSNFTQQEHHSTYVYHEPHALAVYTFTRLSPTHIPTVFDHISVPPHPQDQHILSLQMILLFLPLISWHLIVKSEPSSKHVSRSIVFILICFTGTERVSVSSSSLVSPSILPLLFYFLLICYQFIFCQQFHKFGWCNSNGDTGYEYWYNRGREAGYKY